MITKVQYLGFDLIGQVILREFDKGYINKGSVENRGL